jgi:hypothetical protein
MDYLPPAGLKFFDVLRAVLTTDTMLFGKGQPGLPIPVDPGISQTRPHPTRSGLVVHRGVDAQSECTAAELSRPACG